MLFQESEWFYATSSSDLVFDSLDRLNTFVADAIVDMLFQLRSPRFCQFDLT